jgi:hypothetical protein
VVLAWLASAFLEASIKVLPAWAGRAASVGADVFKVRHAMRLTDMVTRWVAQCTADDMHSFVARLMHVLHTL